MIENKQGVDSATARQIEEGICRHKEAFFTPPVDGDVTAGTMPPLIMPTKIPLFTESPVIASDALFSYPETPAVLLGALSASESVVVMQNDQGWKGVFDQSKGLKERMRALPYVAKILTWVRAFVQLGSNRHKQQVELNELRHQCAQTEDKLTQVNTRLTLVQTYIDQKVAAQAHEITLKLDIMNRAWQARMQAQEGIEAASRLHALERVDVARRFQRLDMLDVGTRLTKLEQIETSRKLKHLADLLHLTQQENEKLKKQVQALQQVCTLAPAAIPQAQHSDEQAQRATTSEKAISTQATLDQFFSDFESAFRGEKGEIKQRLKVYLPYLRQAQKRTVPSVSFSVIDVGCGRGEWLELMAEEGVQTLGIDLNEHKVKACLAAGLAAKATDAIAYLREQTAGSLTAVTGFHLIEHLPFEQLLALFDAAYQALQPGGILIFETPNPENLLVGACNFYYDPTHLHPIVPHVAQFMATQRGFAHAEILRLHPYPDNHLSKGDAHVDQIVNRYLFGEQDYALIAKK